MPSAALTTRELVAKINRLHEEILSSANTSLAKAIESGELLADTKETIGHGNWMLWAQSNLKFSIKTAERYITVFKHAQKSNSSELSNLNAVYKSLESNTKEKRVSKNGCETTKKGGKNLDSTGYPITAHAMEFWKRKPEVQALLTAVSKLRSTIRAYVDSGDQMFGGLFQSADLSLGQAYTEIQHLMPYAVCLECQGRPPDRGCAFCHSTGMISKWRYETIADQGKRRIREKSNEQSAP